MDYQTQEEKRGWSYRFRRWKISVKQRLENGLRGIYNQIYIYKYIFIYLFRYEELKKQKTLIEKESANLLKGMENNHLKAVEELENLYEKKLAFENEKYL